MLCDQNDLVQHTAVRKLSCHCPYLFTVIYLVNLGHFEKESLKKAQAGLRLKVFLPQTPSVLTWQT